MNSFDELFIPDIKKERAIPVLIQNQKTRFQKVVFDNHLVFLVCAGLSDRFLGIFLQNVAKSSMVICSYYFFKTYKFIVAKPTQLLKQIIQVVTIFTLYSQGACNAATLENNRDTEDIKSLIAKAEIQNKIPRGLLGAIAEVESSHKSYAINLGGRSIYASSYSEALSEVKKQVSLGKTNIDVGVMQLNYRWHRKSFSSLEDMLSPKTNISYAASLLKSLYNQHGNWQQAVRHYHSANLKHSRKYSRKVSMIWLASN